MAEVRHHGWWYSIGGTDAASKQTFLILESLISVRIADTVDHRKSAPVLTVPVSRQRHRVVEVRWPATSRAIYLSFVTQATLGYGDIVPVGEHAQGVVVAQGMGGRMYLAVLIARLVSLYAAQGNR